LQAAWYDSQQANVNYKPNFVIPPVFYDDLIDEQPQASACHLMPTTYNEPMFDQPEPTMSSPVAKKRKYAMEGTGGKRVARPPDAKSHESMLTEELKMEMRRVFSEHFEVKPGARMHFSELLNAFTASRNARGMPVSDEDASLLHRHGKKYFKEQWPHTVYRHVKKVYCYTDVNRK
jgi:hypothetical protein